MKKSIKIEGLAIGDDHPCFIIGEIGSNHCLDKNVVKELIDASAEAKFDAVKFQIYDPKEAFSALEMTTDVNLDHLYGVKPWWEVARDNILMPRDWFEEMFQYARSKDLIPLSAIHRPEDLDFLIPFGLPMIKIASIDLHFHNLLKKLASYNLPFLISTGMAYLSEIDETIRLLTKEGCNDVILLHCVSCYPPKPIDTNLRNITTFKNAFEIPVGYSDHSPSNFSAVAAVTLGANVIEKHITLDKTTPGPDHPFALEPPGMKELVRGIREVELSLGKTKRLISDAETASRKMIRRSIVTKVGLKKGEIITESKIKYARPGSGITTNEFKYVEGRHINQDVEAESILQWDMIN
jgi:N,N'-diacetyllegionaminate synthase